VDSNLNREEKGGIMRVKDLIEELEECDQESKILIYDKLRDETREIYEIHADVGDKILIEILDNE